ncbi:ABC transporter substrate-binding protein [Gulosibacter faecalis]|uniref:ABC transporter substrate-binding protein n=1 Tax=Gulosibacter faecalis TaxID=272240 RepID=A0ABW5UY75_9MICO|nr:iron-siderophore ABC transporter substrate-binding protein [Gulosibacter faecalis]
MTRTSRLAALTAMAGIAAVALAGCGTTEVETPSTDEASADVSATCADDTTTTSTGPVTITDQLGRTVELDEPAKRVVVLEWQEVEDVLSLCVNPVGVADPEGYSTWVSAEELPEGTADVGQRGEPDLDSIYALDPDLIIVEAFTADDEQLKKLEEGDVPVLATVGADSDGQIDNMKTVFSTIAEALGRSDRADQILDEFDAYLADAKEQLADSDAAGEEFLYIDGWLESGNLSIRAYGEGALFTELGAELGLKPVWTSDLEAEYGDGGVNNEYGLSQIDVESLTAIGDAMIIYANDGAEENYVTELEKNEVWQSLPAVQEDRAYAFPPNVWGAGGPRSVMQAIDGYVEILS